MENAEKLARVLEWMRLNNVKVYSETPSGGFSVERFEEPMPVLLNPGQETVSTEGNPESDADMLFFDGVVPKIKRIEKKKAE